MANFTGNQIRHTYQRLLQLDDFITQNGTGSINLEKVHISGSVYITGSQVISENLRVLGNVTAQQFIATTVSASIVYESGSSQFGNSLDDNHDFTGSLNLTGSMNLNLDELNLDGTFRHTGSLIHSGTISVVTTGDLDITGDITQSGNIDLIGDITQTGNLTRTGNTTLSGSLIQSGTLSMVSTGDIDLTGNITQAGNTSQTGTFYQTGSLIHSGTLSIESTGDINLTGNITQSGNVYLAGNLTQVGNTTQTGSLSHSGSAVAEGTYEVKEGVYGAFFANPQTLEKNITIPANYNSRIFGPITVAAGKTLTVAANAKLEITDI